MIVRRDQFSDPNHQTRFIITTTPGSSRVASARRYGTFAPVSRSPADFHGGATQSIARILRVIFRKRQTSLLIMT